MAATSVVGCVDVTVMDDPHEEGRRECREKRRKREAFQYNYVLHG